MEILVWLGAGFAVIPAVLALIFLAWHALAMVVCDISESIGFDLKGYALKKLRNLFNKGE